MFLWRCQTESPEVPQVHTPSVSLLDCVLIHSTGVETFCSEPEMSPAAGAQEKAGD